MNETQAQDLKQEIEQAREQASETKDRAQYLALCLQNIEAATDYLTAHGISTDTAKDLQIGYDNSIEGAETLIIPRDNEYTVIFTENGEQIGSNAPFNTIRLYEGNDNIYVTGSIIDAMSIEEAGQPCIAINNPASVEKFKQLVERYPITAHLILCLYGEQWRQAREELTKALKWYDVSFSEKDLKQDRETINARLVFERDAFITDVLATQPPEIRYNNATAAAHLKKIKAGIAAEADKPALSTGFTELDALLDGGIGTGLYIIGAISSLGKTTFIVQLSDYIAKQGKDVLFFSLEQPEREIIAKSVSRETYNAALLKTGNTRHAKSTTGILNGRHYKNYTQEEKQIIQDAWSNYEAYADRIRIFEGVGNIGVKEIEQRIKDHEKYTGNKPVIFIDYLQIMAAYEDGRRSYTDKQAVDKNILELKRISRNYTIIAISSFNRDSYTEPVTLSSFKESGAIEYTSDILIGLQYKGMDYKIVNGKRETESAHAARVQTEVINVQQERGKRGEAQDVQLKVLKNRNYKRGAADLRFYPVFNLYQDAGTPKGTTEKDAQGWTTTAESPFTSQRLKNGVLEEITLFDWDDTIGTDRKTAEDDLPFT